MAKTTRKEMKGRPLIARGGLEALAVLTRCPKHAHKSEGKALAHMRSLIAMKDEEESLHVYRCNTCNMWHVGHY